MTLGIWNGTGHMLELNVIISLPLIYLIVCYPAQRKNLQWGLRHYDGAGDTLALTNCVHLYQTFASHQFM